MHLSRAGGLFAWLRRQRNTAVLWGKRLPDVHRTSFVDRSARVSRDLVAEAYVFIARGCHIDPGVHIGRYSMLAPEVAIVGDDHVWDVVGIPIQFAGRPRQTSTEIADDVWIGYRALIRRGVTIHRGAIVAAHSVVTRDVPAYAIVAGCPAVVVGERFSDPEDRGRHDKSLSGAVVATNFAEPLRGFEAGE